MKHYLVTYTLRNGVRASLHMLATSSCAAILQVLSLFGDSVRACTALPSPAVVTAPPVYRSLP